MDFFDDFLVAPVEKTFNQWVRSVDPGQLREGLRSDLDGVHAQVVLMPWAEDEFYKGKNVRVG